MLTFLDLQIQDKALGMVQTLSTYSQEHLDIKENMELRFLRLPPGWLPCLPLLQG